MVQARSSRRQFLSTAALAAGAVASRPLWAAEPTDQRVAAIVAHTIGIDTHNHIDLPLSDAELPGPEINLRDEMKRSGLSTVCATFATDYQQGDAYQRFLHGLAATDQVLARNKMTRSLTAKDVRAAHKKSEPTMIQSVEGAHFLEGRIDRVDEAYGRGLRHLGLLHDSDATVPLGDVYTNPPRFDGLTPFGIEVVRRCNKLGILVDLAHANLQSTEAALDATSKPVIVSHTGLDTQLGTDPHKAQMMRPRLISKVQAKLVANAGGAIGVWTHLSATPLEYAQNIRAMVDAIGIDHVILGTDTKLTLPNPGHANFPPHGESQPQDAHAYDDRPKGPPQGQPHPGERTNTAWADQTQGFYYVVVEAMLKTGFTEGEIAKIGGGNYLRIFAEATS